MATINEDTVEYIAKLARIKLDQKEVKKFVEDLEKILEYVSQLNKLSTENIEPARHVLSLSNVCRKDIKKSSLPVEEVLKNAPEKLDNMFKVPGII